MERDVAGKKTGRRVVGGADPASEFGGTLGDVDGPRGTPPQGRRWHRVQGATGMTQACH